MKTLFYSLSAVAVLTAAFAGWNYYAFNMRPMSEQRRVLLIDVAPNSNLWAVRSQLETEGLRIDPLSFRVWARLNDSSALRVGEFEIKSHWSASKALGQILHGRPRLWRFTIREGDNIFDITSEWERQFPDIGGPSLMELFRDPKYLSRMQAPMALPDDVKPSLEGFIFPETYSFQKYDSTTKIVESMLRQFERRARPILELHPWGDTPAGRYRLLVLASMVEKESSSVPEQPLVASVFWNRLKKGMRMQSDPTIIYGWLPEFEGRIRTVHLRTPTPYNTYTIRELPPTPIANPGEGAIRAVVQPAETEYLFFVSRNDGTHVFSKDYRTHNKYVDQFQRRK